MTPRKLFPASQLAAMLPIGQHQGRNEGAFNLTFFFHRHHRQNKKAIVVHTTDPENIVALLIRLLHNHFVVEETGINKPMPESSVENMLNPNFWKLSSERSLFIQLPTQDLGSKEAAFLGKARLLVMQHLDNDNFNYKQLAQLMYISISQLNKRLKNAVGKSANHFINSIRLEHARHLLLTTDSLVKEIGYLCGFASVFRFNQVFKEHFGMSPGAYRNTAPQNGSAL